MKSPLWYALQPADNCLTVHSLNFTTGVFDASSWPGYDDTFTPQFGSYITTYYHAEATGEYTIRVITRQAVLLYFDDSTTPSIAMQYNGGKETTSTNTFTLRAGYHLVRIAWSNESADLRLEVVIGPNGQLRLLDDSNCRLGGLAPVALHFPSIAAVVGQRVAIAPSLYGGSEIREVTAQPALPTGLVWNPERGQIEGTVSVEVARGREA